MTLTHLDLDRIEGLAGKATPGPWEVGLAGDYPRDSSLDADHTPIHSDTWGAFASVVTSMNGGGRVGTSEQGKANAAYIAALDPTTVTALITRIRELEEALDKLRSYSVDIEAGRINYRPLDHIAVADAALQR